MKGGMKGGWADPGGGVKGGVKGGWADPGGGVKGGWADPRGNDWLLVPPALLSRRTPSAVRLAAY